MDKIDLLEKGLAELRDLNYTLKLSINTLELENRYLKQSVEDLRALLQKEVDKREKDDSTRKAGNTALRVAIVAGSLSFISTLVVGILNFLK